MAFSLTTIEYHNTTSEDGEEIGDRDILKLNVSVAWVCLYAVVYGIIIFGAVTGNLLVMWSYAIEPKLRRPNNIFLLSLSVVDFLTGLIGVPMAIFARLFTGPYLCYAGMRPYVFLFVIQMCSCSIAHLVVITIDRYIAVTKPLKYNLIVTTRKSRRWLFFTWLIGITVGSLSVMTPPRDPTQWICGYQKPTGIYAHRIITILTVPVFLLFMCVCYVRIFAVARRHVESTKSRKRAQSQTVDKSVDRRMMRTVVTSATVLVAFAFCWVPTSFKFIVEQYIVTNDEELFIIQTATEILSFGNSMINPIIYGYRNELFRQTYKRVVREVWCRFLVPTRRMGQSGRPLTTGKTPAASLSTINPSFDNKDA